MSSEKTREFCILCLTVFWGLLLDWVLLSSCLTAISNTIRFSLRICICYFVFVFFRCVYLRYENLYSAALLSCTVAQQALMKAGIWHQATAATTAQRQKIPNPKLKGNSKHKLRNQRTRAYEEFCTHAWKYKTCTTPISSDNWYIWEWLI